MRGNQGDNGKLVYSQTPLKRWLTDPSYFLKSPIFLENELFRATAGWIAFENVVTLDLAPKLPLLQFDNAWEQTRDYIEKALQVIEGKGWSGRLSEDESKLIIRALGEPPVSCFAIYMITVSQPDGSAENCVYIGRTNSINHRFKSGHHAFTKLHADKFSSLKKRLYLASLWIEVDDDHTFPIEWFRDFDRDTLLADIEAQLIYDLQPELNDSGKKSLLVKNTPIHIAIQNTVSRCLDAHCVGPERGAWLDN